MLVGQPGEDVRDLGDREVAPSAGLRPLRINYQIGRGERSEPAAAVHVLDQRLGAVYAGAVAEGDAGTFEHQADEFPAALDARPVPQVVAHSSVAPWAMARIASAWTRWP